MTENAGLVTSGLGRVGRNKRYILWFFLMNLCLAWFAGGAFRQQASVVLNNSLHAGSLVQGFSMGTLIEMFARPEFGPNDAASMRILEINCSIAPPKAENHSMIEVRVRLKTWPHHLGVGVRSRAASSFP